MQLPEKFSEIQNLELLAKELVDGFIIGLHKSPYHGFSVEFAEHRLYQTGDNLKHVDWKVYGKKDIMFIKKFEEETNLRCCIAIDTSGSMHFPEKKITKLQHSCIASSALMQLLKQQLDAFAIVPIINAATIGKPKFSSTNAHYKQQLAVLQNIAEQKHTIQELAISDSLHELGETIPQRSLIILFTDIPYQEIVNKKFTDSLLHLKYRKHEVIVFHLIDEQMEQLFNFDNSPYEFKDLETGATIKLHPNSVKEKYLTKLKDYQNSIQNFCRAHNIAHVPYNLSEPISKILLEYLQKRSKMM